MNKRYSEKERIRLVSGYVGSGESRASYAKGHGVSVGSLARWEAELELARGSEAGMRFVEVEVPAKPTGAAPSSLMTPSSAKPSPAST